MIEAIEIRIKENKVGIKSLSNSIVTLSLEGKYGGVKSGDEVVAYGHRYLVIGFSGQMTPFTRKIWTLRKDENEVTSWKEESMVGVEIIKAEKPMTVETAVGIINKFQNS